MALVTIQRSPSPSVELDQDQTDSSEEVAEGKSQMRKRSRTSKQKLRTILSSMRFLSKLRPCLSQSYFTVKGAALILPHTEVTKKSAHKSHGGEIQDHLQAMLHLLRPEDTIKIAVRLEDINHLQRYMALVSTKGRQDLEEAVILGIDCSNADASIGLVLPIWMGLKIKLGGDGGFSLSTDEQCYMFKPVSVQAMWSAIQSFVKVQHIADEMKFIPDGLSHTWVGYYRSLVDHREAVRSGQWNVEGVEVFAPSNLSIKSQDGDEKIKLVISQTLKEVMMTVDLDDATSIMLRKAVEEKMNLSLTEFKGYFDEEVMRILGQMDEPSEILDFLYLGSEWNASNLDELMGKGVDYILNVTKEIDNFFEGRLHYYNVRVVDEEKADLLKHWDKTYKFISKARSQNSKVLVHCKMGVSRSASTVMAFLMKDRRWSVEEAFQFVKACRGCVHPNAGFMDQLHMYEAILTASNKRDIFRSKSDQNLLDEEPTEEDEETSPAHFLGDSLFHTMSHSDWLPACGGVACGEEWTGSSHQDPVQESEESRSAVPVPASEESGSADPVQESEESHGVDPVQESEESHGVDPVQESEESHGVDPVQESEESHGVDPVQKSEESRCADPVQESEESRCADPVQEDLPDPSSTTPADTRTIELLVSELDTPQTSHSTIRPTGLPLDVDMAHEADRAMSLSKVKDCSQQQASLAAQSSRLRTDTELQASQSSRLRTDTELQASRLRADTELQASRLRADTELQASRLRADTELEVSQSSRLRTDTELEVSQSSRLRADTELQVSQSSRLRTDTELQVSQSSRLRADTELQASRLRADTELEVSQSSRLRTDTELEVSQSSRLRADTELQVSQSSRLRADTELQASRLRADTELQASQSSRLRADTELQASQSSRLRADTELQPSLAAQSSRLRADTKLQASRLRADTELQASLAAQSSRLRTDTELQASLAAQSSRLRADTELQASQSSRLRADTELQVSWLRADTELQASLAAQSSRLKADTELQASRLRADTELQASLAAQSSRLKADTELQASRLRADTELQASLAAQSLKLKADSSWIRQDTALEEDEIQTVSVDASVPSRMLCHSTEQTVSGCKTASHEPSVLSREDNCKQFVHVAVTVPELLPYLYAISVPGEGTSAENPGTATAAELSQTSEGFNIGTREACNIGTREACNIGTREACNIGTSEACNIGTREACNIGTIEEGQPVVDQQAVDQGLGKSVAIRISEAAFILDTREERRLLDRVCLHEPTSTMSSSHSCMDLCPQGDGDAGNLSLFEREKIPLVPGTVLRTRLEIEGRRRNDDQEVVRATSPVLRSTSLKQQRDVARSRYTQSHRSVTSSPFSRKSLDDLQSLGAIGIKPVKDIGFSGHRSPGHVDGGRGGLSDAVDSSCAAAETPLRSLYSRQPGSTSVGSQVQDETSSPAEGKAAAWAGPDKQSTPGASQSDDADEGKFDSLTLALIREIGSALSTSPSPAQPADAPGTNLVKYFVRKIEKQTETPQRSACKVPLRGHIFRRATKEPSEHSVTGEGVHLEDLPTASQSALATPARPREISAQATSTAFLELTTQPGGQEDFCSTGQFYITRQVGSTGQVCSTANPGSDLCRSNPKVHADGHTLSQASSPTLESKHNTRAAVVPVTRPDAAIKPESSPSLSVGCDSAEPPVVRHLVEQFELTGQDSVSLMHGQENVNVFKDVQRESQACVSSPQDSSLHPSGPQLSRETSNLHPSGPQPSHETSNLHPSGPPPSHETSNLHPSGPQPPRETSPQDSNLHPTSQDASSRISPAQTALRLEKTPAHESSPHIPATAPTSSPHIPTTSHQLVFGQELPSVEAGYNSDAITACPSTHTNAEPSESTAMIVDTHYEEASSCKQSLSCGSSTETYRSTDRSLHQGCSSPAAPHKVEEYVGLDNVLMRQMSNVGRRIRRLHGKSHPVTKLSSQQLGRGSFYSSM